MEKLSICILMTILIISFSMIYQANGQDSEPDGHADLGFVGGIEIYGSDPFSGEDAAEGDVVTIIVKVKNFGGSIAENVDLSFSVDGVIKRVNTIRTVTNETDDVKTVIFSWVAERGNHLLEVIIDPENSVIEINDQSQGENNNIISKQISVSHNPSVKERIDSPSPFAITGFVALVFLFLIRRFWIRKDK